MNQESKNFYTDLYNTRSRRLTEEELWEVRKKIEQGMSVLEAASTVDLGGGKTAEYTALQQRLQRKYPGWYQDMRDKGLIALGAGSKGKYKKERDKANLEEYKKHPAVIDILNGETYDAVLAKYENTEHQLTRGTLNSRVKAVVAASGGKVKLKRTRRVRKTSAPATTTTSPPESTPTPQSIYRNRHQPRNPSTGIGIVSTTPTGIGITSNPVTPPRNPTPSPPLT